MDLLWYLLGGAAIAALVRWWQPRLRWPALAAYLLLAGAFYGGALATPALQVPTDVAYTYRPWRQTLAAPVAPRNALLYDVVTQMVPFRTLVRERLLRGEAPLWTREIGAGQPLLGNAQSAPFAPLHLLALPLPPLRAMTLAVAWQALLALLLMHALARELGAGEAGSPLAALGFAFSTYTVAWAYYPIGMAACWIPGVLLGVVMLRRGGRGATAGLVACAVGLALSGHPESLTHTALAAAATTMALLTRSRPELSRGRFVGRLGIAAALSAALAAPVLLPFLQVMRESECFAFIAGAGGTFPAPEWQPSALRVLVDPLAYGSPRDGNWLGPANFNETCTSWAGLLPLALAIAGAAAGVGTGLRRRLRRPRRAGDTGELDAAALDARPPDAGSLGGTPPDARLAAARQPDAKLPDARPLRAGPPGARPTAARSADARPAWLLLAALVALGAAFGAPPLIALFHAVPGLAIVPAARLRLLAVLAISIGAGLSLEALAARRSGRWVAAGCIAAASFALLAMRPPGGGWQHAWWIATLAGAGAAVVAGALPAARRWFPWIVVAATAGDLALLGVRYNPLVPAALDLAPPPVLRPLLAMPDRDGFRVTGMTGDLLPNLAATYGLADPRFYDPMHPRAVREVIGRALGSGHGLVAVIDPATIAVGNRTIDAPGRPMLDYLGVRYMLMRSGGLLPLPWRRAWNATGGRMWENPAAMPLFGMPARIDRVATHDQAIARAAANDDFRAVGFVELGDDAAAADSVGRGASSSMPQRGDVRLHRVESNGFTVDVATATGGVVVSSVSLSSGWRIAVDGSEVEPLRVNGAFIGFAVPPGRHRAVLDYRPAGWTWGLRLAAAGALAAAAITIRGRLRRLVSRPRPAPA